MFHTSSCPRGLSFSISFGLSGAGQYETTVDLFRVDFAGAIESILSTWIEIFIRNPVESLMRKYIECCYLCLWAQEEFGTLGLNTGEDPFILFLIFVLIFSPSNWTQQQQQLNANVSPGNSRPGLIISGGCMMMMKRERTKSIQSGSDFYSTTCVAPQEICTSIYHMPPPGDYLADSCACHGHRHRSLHCNCIHSIVHFTRMDVRIFLMKHKPAFNRLRGCLFSDMSVEIMPLRLSSRNLTCSILGAGTVGWFFFHAGVEQVDGFIYFSVGLGRIRTSWKSKMGQSRLTLKLEFELRTRRLKRENMATSIQSQSASASGKVADDKIDTLSSTRSDVETAPLSEGEYARLEKSTMRKVDWRLLPLLGILTSLSLIDRSNLGLARIVGMDHDLHLSVGARYSIVSCIYFVPYILLELPSNIVLRKAGAVHWLAFLAVSWGLVQLGMGFVPTWGFLALCRVFLGTFEAGFFPALVFIITTWYTRHEVQKRLAAFYVVSIVIGGFSAIFAYVLSLLGGKLGIAGWSWIFIMEGAITVVFGVLGWFFLPGFPDQNSFLTAEQTALVLERVEKDRGDSVPDDLTKEKLIRYLLDWKIWAVGLMYMCATLPAYAISFFITIILRGMGWSVSASLLLSAPPYIFAAISIMFFAWISDKYRQRAAILAIQAFITIIGLFLTGYAPEAGWRYAGIFLSNAGSGGCIPGILAYSSNNIISHTKKSVSTAIVVSFGGIGGMFASLVFRQVDSPEYRPGIWATIGSQFLMLILLAITTMHYRHKNKAVRDGTAGEPLEGQPGFLYTL